MKKNKKTIAGAVHCVSSGSVIAVAIVVLVSIATVCIGLLPKKVDAANADISRSYIADEDIPAGSLVSLKTGTTDHVILADYNANDQLLGVAVATDGSLLTINKSDSGIQVAIAGRANVLVSTINGDIKTGDMVSESFIKGVGAKAFANSKVIGIAQQDYSFSQEKSETNIKEVNLNSKKVKTAVSTIPVLIALTSVNANQITFLQKWATNIAGKPVSIARIVLSGLITLVVLTMLIIMIRESIASSIAAVGRNPLARISIFEALAQIMVMVALICIVGVATVYLVIRL